MHLVCLQLVRSEESRSNGISTRIVKGGVETVSGEYKEFGYASAGLVNGYASDQLAEKFVELTQSLDGVERVCDLGCGNGYIASRLGTLGVDVTGVDASLSGVNIANQNYASDKIRFVKAEFGPDLTDALALRGQFDLVVSSDVIEHLYRPAVLLETAVTLLKPGGYLIVGTPYHGYLKNLALSILDGWDAHHTVAWNGGHIKFFSVKTLSSLVMCQGFELMGFHYLGRAPWLWKNMICVAKKKSV